MLITVHGAVGALIGENVNSTLWAFVLSFVIHFAMDMIPHGDKYQVAYFKKEKKLNKIVNLVIVDACLGFIFLTFYMSNVKATGLNMAPIIAGIIGGILPDFLVAIYNLQKKYFFRLNYVHHRIHQLIKFDIPFKLAFVLQMALLGVIWNLYKF